MVQSKSALRSLWRASILFTAIALSCQCGRSDSKEDEDQDETEAGLRTIFIARRSIVMTCLPKETVVDCLLKAGINLPVCHKSAFVDVYQRCKATAGGMDNGWRTYCGATASSVACMNSIAQQITEKKIDIPSLQRAITQDPHYANFQTFLLEMGISPAMGLNLVAPATDIKTIVIASTRVSGSSSIGGNNTGPCPGPYCTSPSEGSCGKAQGERITLDPAVIRKYDVSFNGCSSCSPTPSPTPTATPTPKPTATATPKPTATATPKPTATATPKPTATPTLAPSPTGTETPAPSDAPETTSIPETFGNNPWNSEFKLPAHLAQRVKRGPVFALGAKHAHTRMDAGTRWFPTVGQATGPMLAQSEGCRVISDKLSAVDSRAIKGIIKVKVKASVGAGGEGEVETVITGANSTALTLNVPGNLIGQCNPSGSYVLPPGSTMEVCVSGSTSLDVKATLIAGLDIIAVGTLAGGGIGETLTKTAIRCKTLDVQGRTISEADAAGLAWVETLNQQVKAKMEADHKLPVYAFTGISCKKDPGANETGSCNCWFKCYREPAAPQPRCSRFQRSYLGGLAKDLAPSTLKQCEALNIPQPQLGQRHECSRLREVQMWDQDWYQNGCYWNGHSAQRDSCTWTSPYHECSINPLGTRCRQK